MSDVGLWRIHDDVAWAVDKARAGHVERPRVAYPKGKNENLHWRDAGWSRENPRVAHGEALVTQGLALRSPSQHETSQFETPLLGAQDDPKNRPEN